MFFILFFNLFFCGTSEQRTCLSQLAILSYVERLSALQRFKMY